jgi:hypothetical protein
LRSPIQRRRLDVLRALALVHNATHSAANLQSEQNKKKSHQKITQRDFIIAPLVPSSFMNLCHLASATNAEIMTGFSGSRRKASGIPEYAQVLTR